MSQYETRIKNAFKTGLNLKEGMYQEQFYIGRFISGWKQPVDCDNNRVGRRKIDFKINGADTIFKVARPVYAEIDGTQHDDPYSSFNDPSYNEEGELIWSRSQNFNDQVDRDYYVNIKAEEANAIMIRVKEPIWRSKNPAYYEQLEALEQKIQSPGFLAFMIQLCEQRHYKGCIITWDGVKFITKGRKWPKPKYFEGT